MLILGVVVDAYLYIVSSRLAHILRLIFNDLFQRRQTDIRQLADGILFTVVGNIADDCI